MADEYSIHKGKEIFSLKKIKQKIFLLLRLNPLPVVKVYNGFGNAKKIIVLGHVLKLSPLPRKTYRQNWLTNVLSILRLFMVIPFSGAKVSVSWEGNTFYAETAKDGFFRFEIPVKVPTGSGWQTVAVKLGEQKYVLRAIEGVGKIYIPALSAYGFISDIDDTFLISHSAKLRRRLYVLFTKNARSRKPFEGVVNHYQLLAHGNKSQNVENPFFYVSGSEWNLYDFIVEFSRANKLPRGVFLLSQIKRLSESLKSGQNNLSTKFVRIVRIMEAYPQLRFVLLGDDSQQDPEIYSSIVSHFPGKIFAVYIRRIRPANFEKTRSIIDALESQNVHCCYFEHSAQAVIHSKKIGLIG